MADFRDQQPDKLGRECALAGGDIESNPFVPEPIDFIQPMRGVSTSADRVQVNAIDHSTN